MKALKKEFTDRGIKFSPVKHPGFDAQKYTYNGETFETWLVSTHNNVIGTFTWKVGTYPTRRAMSSNFDGYRN